MPKFNLIILFISISITGCSTTLNNQGLGVRVVQDASLVKGCKFLESIESSSSWGGFAATGIGYRSAMNELKNVAGEVGGNMVLIATLTNTMGGTNMSGDVYKCSNQDS